MHKLLALLIFCGTLMSCAGNIPQIPAQGEISGLPVRTTVDSDIAKYFLEHYLKGERSRAELDTVIDTTVRDAGIGVPSRSFLKSIAQRYSIDFAALILGQSLLRHPDNRQVQSIFLQEFSQLKLNAQKTQTPISSDKSGYLIVFVSGWFYKSQPENGADFAKPRQALTDAGVKTTLLEIDENGTVEHNGDLIVKQLITLSNSEKKIVVVSASKAGPEVALALSELQKIDTHHSVKAWVNIGGVLRGSALADKALTWPTCWYVKLFIINGDSFDGIESMTTLRSTKRANRVMLPSDIIVVNYVGIPLSGQVTERARLGYSLLRKEGPNDGLTQIVDEIPVASITIPEIGLDHFFSDPEIHIKTVALANTIVRLVESRKATPTETSAETSGSQETSAQTSGSDSQTSRPPDLQTSADLETSRPRQRPRRTSGSDSNYRQDAHFM